MPLYFTVICILLWACQKEIHVNDTFPFELKGNIIDTNVFKDQKTQTSFTIVPTQKVDGTVYYFSYVVDKGDGKFYLEDGTALEPNTTYSVNDFDFKRYFVCNTIGTNTVIVTVDNEVTEKQSVTLNYESKYKPFTYILSNNLDLYPIGELSPITYTITDDYEETNYRFTYFVENGQGQLFSQSTAQDGTDNYTALEIGKSSALPKGTHKLYYKPLNLSDGTHKIKTTIAAADGQEKKLDLDLKVSESNFSFTAASSVAEAMANSEIDHNFTLSPIGTPSKYYSLTFTSTGTAIVKYNGNSYNAGQSIPITTQDIAKKAWTVKYIGSNASSHVVNYNLSSDNGKTHNQEVSLNIFDFSFNASVASSLIARTKSTDINYNITSVGKNDLTFTIGFEYLSGSAQGELRKDASLMVANAFYPTITGNKGLSFKGTNAGEVKMRIITKDNFGNIKKSNILNINVVQSDFNFVATSSKNQITTAEDVQQNFSITQTQNFDLTYTLKFKTNNNKGVLIYDGKQFNPGDAIVIKKNDIQNKGWLATFRTPAALDYSIEYTLTSTAEVSRLATVSLKVVPPVAPPKITKAEFRYDIADNLSRPCGSHKTDDTFGTCYHDAYLLITIYTDKTNVTNFQVKNTDTNFTSSELNFVAGPNLVRNGNLEFRCTTFDSLNPILSACHKVQNYTASFFGTVNFGQKLEVRVKANGLWSDWKKATSNGIKITPCKGL